MASPKGQSDQVWSGAHLLDIAEDIRGGSSRLPVTYASFTLQHVNTALVRLGFQLADGKDYDQELQFLEQTLVPESDAYPAARVAAIVGLWPHIAAKCYGGPGVSPGASEERLQARGRLCAFQEGLYSNVAAVMDWISESFRLSNREEGLERFDWDERERWRPVTLLGSNDCPVDLCAVDYLLREIVQLTAAETDIRKAIRAIHSRATGTSETLDPALCQTAFQKLSVSQITVFFPENSGDESDPGAVLHELVFVSNREGDKLPDELLPFHWRTVKGWEKDPERWNFRRLCHLIFSGREGREYEGFRTHREATLHAIEDTSVFPGGLSTFEYLSSRGDDRWFAQKLGNLPADAIPDWSDNSWWEQATAEEVWRGLCPGQNLELFCNHHTAALWDYLVSRETPKIYSSSREMLQETTQRPRPAPQFGYLLELLLRREFETRTSFFFALARAGGVADSKTPDSRGQITQFIGGSFLGLERPGVPFSTARFGEICDRLRPLILALGHFTTRRAIHRRVEKARLQEASYEGRVGQILELLSGSGDFSRDGSMLFCSFPKASGSEKGHAKVAERDHENTHPEPSRRQIASVLPMHCAPRPSRSTIPIARGCDRTLKALFEISSNPDIHSLELFLEKGEELFPGISATSVVCLQCLKETLVHVLRDVIPDDRIEVSADSKHSFELPSRPGIRFAISLTRFVQTVKIAAPVDKLTLSPGQAVIHFESLPGPLFEAWNRVNMTGSFDNRRTPGPIGGALLNLKKCEPFDPNGVDRKLSAWANFLTNSHFATRLALGVLPDRVWARWPHRDITS